MGRCDPHSLSALAASCSAFVRLGRPFVFTALSHTLFIGSLRTIRAQTASVVSCLEPVYGILLAALFLGEIPSRREVLGGAVVFACAIWGSLKKEA